MRRSWISALVATLVASVAFISFQNCSPQNFSLSASSSVHSKESSSHSQPMAQGGGDNYDGKPFTFEPSANCSDGKKGTSLIKRGDDGIYRLFRDSCQDLPTPIALRNAEIEIEPRERYIIFRQRIYVSSAALACEAGARITLVGSTLTNATGETLNISNINREPMATNLTTFTGGLDLQVTNLAVGRSVRVRVNLGSCGEFRSVTSLSHPYFCFDHAVGPCDRTTVPSGFPNAGIPLRGNCSSPIYLFGALSGTVDGITQPREATDPNCTLPP